jgi:hypothetical protein
MVAAGIILQAIIAGSQQPVYQLDFTTPGNLPFEAKSRKHILQTPNFLIYALARPQIGHRL